MARVVVLDWRHLLGKGVQISGANSIQQRSTKRSCFCSAFLFKQVTCLLSSGLAQLACAVPRLRISMFNLPQSGIAHLHWANQISKHFRLAGGPCIHTYSLVFCLPSWTKRSNAFYPCIKLGKQLPQPALPVSTSAPSCGTNQSWCQHQCLVPIQSVPWIVHTVHPSLFIFWIRKFGRCAIILYLIVQLSFLRSSLYAACLRSKDQILAYVAHDMSPGWCKNRTVSKNGLPCHCAVLGSDALVKYTQKTWIFQSRVQVQ